MREREGDNAAVISRPMLYADFLPNQNHRPQVYNLILRASHLLSRSTGGEEMGDPGNETAQVADLQQKMLSQNRPGK